MKSGFNPMFGRGLLLLGVILILSVTGCDMGGDHYSLGSTPPESVRQLEAGVVEPTLLYLHLPIETPAKDAGGFFSLVESAASSMNQVVFKNYFKPLSSLILNDPLPYSTDPLVRVEDLTWILAEPLTSSDPAVPRLTIQRQSDLSSVQIYSLRNRGAWRAESGLPGSLGEFPWQVVWTMNTQVDAPLALAKERPGFGKGTFQLDLASAAAAIGFSQTSRGKIDGAFDGSNCLVEPGLLNGALLKQMRLRLDDYIANVNRSDLPFDLDYELTHCAPLYEAGAGTPALCACSTEEIPENCLNGAGNFRFNTQFDWINPNAQDGESSPAELFDIELAWTQEQAMVLRVSSHGGDIDSRYARVEMRACWNAPSDGLGATLSFQGYYYFPSGGGAPSIDESSRIGSIDACPFDFDADLRDSDATDNAAACWVGARLSLPNDASPDGDETPADGDETEDEAAP